MKVESPDFTEQELEGFVDELIEHERGVLVDRLERASDRLAALAARIPKDQPPDEEGWNPHEVLTHIAVLSKFWGMAAYKIAKGDWTELPLVENVRLRDVVGQQLVALPDEELIEQARADHRRSLAFLRSVAPADLRREVVADGRWRMTAEDVARRSLVGHLEMHLDQLEAALAGR
jgi:uncharacterized damage-inducible protein DinB